MGLVAIAGAGLALARGKARVRVGRVPGLGPQRRAGGGRRHQRGVQHRPLLQHQPALFHLLVELGEQLLRQSRLDQPVAEAAQRRVIGGIVLQAQSEEAAERHPVIERFLQLGIRQRVPLLQQQGLEHQQPIVGRPSGPLGAQVAQQLLEAIPADRLLDPLQHPVATQLRRGERLQKTPLSRPRHRNLPASKSTDTSESHIPGITQRFRKGRGQGEGFCAQARA